MGSINNINKCYNLDKNAINELKKKVILYLNKLLCLTEKGHKPCYGFILEMVSLIDLYEHNLVDKDELLFIIQSYLNNKWLTIYYLLYCL